MFFPAGQIFFVLAIKVFLYNSQFDRTSENVNTQDYLYMELGGRFREVGGRQWKRLGIISFIIISYNGNIRTYLCFGLKGIKISKQFMNSVAVFVLTLTC